MKTIVNGKYGQYTIYDKCIAVGYQFFNSIDEIEKKNEEALRGYTKGYVMYNGKYSQVSKIEGSSIDRKNG